MDPLAGRRRREYQTATSSPDTVRGIGVLGLRLMRGLPLRRITLAVAAAGVLGAAPVGAVAQVGGATTFVQAAKGGSFQGGRLTLRGVGRSVRWKTVGPGRHSGVVSFPLLERQLFSDNAALVATLHVASQRGVVRLRISRPRYRARRGTVGYRVKRLDQRRIPRRFGAASLSIVSPPLVGSSNHHSCQTQLQDNTAYGLQPISSSRGDLDSWAFLSPPTAVIGSNDSANWESDGAAFKGCTNTVVWKFVSDPNNPHPPASPSGTVTLTTTYPWLGVPSYQCSSSYAGVSCKQTYATSGGVVSWDLSSP